MFDVKHIKGKENVCADALSRHEYPEYNFEDDKLEDEPKSWKSPDVLQLQQQDTEFTEVHLFYDRDQNTVVAAIEETVENQLIAQKPDLSMLQQQCPDFRDIYNYLNKGTLPDEPKLARKITIESQQYSFINGI